MLNPQPRPGANTPRTFLHTLFWTLPLHVLAAIVVVGGAAILYSTSLSGHGVWALVGGWSLTALYVVIALVAGTLAGALDAAGRTVERLELGLRTWLHTLPQAGTAGEAAGRTLSTVQQEYRSILDQYVTDAGQHLRLPRWLEKLIRSALQAVVVDRFIASCTERGIHLVAPQEFRNWLLAEGVSLGFMPILDQLSWWRYLLLGLLGLLVVIVLALALLTT